MNRELYNNACLQKYAGEGHLIIDGYVILECCFEACQLTNGKIILLCNFDTIGDASRAFHFTIKRFEGITNDGYLVFGSGNFVNKELSDGGDENFTLFSVQELYVTKNNNILAREVRFGITNLELNLGDQQLSINLKRSGGESLSLILSPSSDYLNKIKYLEFLNDIDVTYFASIEINDVEDIVYLEQAVQDLCYLLSIARRTKIQWIYLERIDSGNGVISRLHSDKKTKRYSSSKLIIEIDLKRFLEITYPMYIERRTIFGFEKGLLDAYLDAQSQEDHIELRAAKLAVTMEMLKTVLLENPKFALREYVIEKKLFEQEIGPQLCSEVNSVISNHLGCGDLKDFDCIKKITCINRTSFLSILRKICRIIRHPLYKETYHFVQCRNSLIHNARFLCEFQKPDCGRDEKVKEYFFLINFLNILILRLLDYNGGYMDYSNIHNITRKML